MSLSSPTPTNPLAKAPRLLSCLLCSQRKIKCDKKTPCTNCTKARRECISAASLPPRRRKKRFAEAELLARLRYYEELLRKKGVNIDDLNEKIDGLAIAEGANSSQPSAPRPQSVDKAREGWDEEHTGRLIVSGTNATHLNK